MYLQVVLKPCIWANFPRGQSMQKNWVNSVLYFIRNKWPLMSSPLDLFSPPIPLCLSLPGFIFQNTITCALPEILTCVSSVLLRNVHTWINVCCLSTHFYAWVNYIVCLCFLNENMVKPVQNDAVFVLFCRKHWADWNVFANICA